MKITAVTPFVVDPGGGKNWLFVKVETDDGLHGWGECYTQADRDQSIEAHVHAAGALPGRPRSVHIKHFTYWAYHDFAAKRGAMDFYCAISGHRAGAVGHRRQGARRSRSTTCSADRAATRSASTPTAGTRAPGRPTAYAAKARGSRGARLHRAQVRPVPQPVARRTSHARPSGRRWSACAPCARRSGRTSTSWSRCTAGWRPMHAIRVARHARAVSTRSGTRSRSRRANIERAGRVPPRDPHADRDRRGALHASFEFREVFERRAADIINPDVCNVRRHPGAEGDRRDGRGRTTWSSRRTTTTAPRSGSPPRCTSRAAMPNFLITEYFVNFEPRGGSRGQPVPRRGRLRRAADRARASASSSTRTPWRATPIASSPRATSPRRGTKGRRRGNFLPAVVVTVVTAPANWHGDEHATGQRGAHHAREQHRHEDASPPKHILHRQPPERPDRALLIDVGASVTIPAPTGRAGSQAADFGATPGSARCAPGSGRCRRRRGAHGRPRPP